MPSIKELYKRLNDVKIDADSINLNTDGLEALLATTQADIALIKADIANGVLADVRDGLGNAITSTTFGSTRRLDVSLSSAGTVGSTTPTSANLYAGTDGTNLRAISVDTSGRINTNINGTVSVSGTFWQATQPVSGSITAAQTTAANLNATVVQGTATNLKTQAENYQGGSAVGSGNPLQVTLANTGANATAIKVDGSAVVQPVTSRGANGEASVASFTSTASSTLKASNANRKLLTIYNEGAGSLYILYGNGTASTTNYSVKLFAGDYIEISQYTGQINAIYQSAGTSRITEIT